MKTFLLSCSRAVSACLRGAVVVCLLLVVGCGVAWGQFTNGQNAQFVVGQMDFVTATPNNGVNGVLYPSSVAIDVANGKLYISEPLNHRVIRLAYPIVSNYPTIEAVFGQAGLGAGLANRGGSAAANTLSSPKGIAVGVGGTLWIVDQGNQRILRFNNAQSAINGVNADVVIGQPDFVSTAGGTTGNRFNLPEDIAFDNVGNMYVADRSNNRVVRVGAAQLATNGPSFSLVLGQSTYFSSVAGNSINGLNAPVSVGIDIAANSLFVADNLSNRVVRFNNVTSLTDFANANGVLGQPDFTSGVPNNGGLSASSIWNPYCVKVDATGKLFVADGGNNHRILIFNNAVSKPDNGTADNVIGQSSFTVNGSALAAFRFNLPTGIAAVGTNLLVADNNNHRVLQFSSLPPPTTFYFNTGDPANTANWGSNPGGTGTPPADFTTAGNTYIMETGKNGTLAGPLTFGINTVFTMQAGSTLNFGAGNLTLNGAINLGGQFVSTGARSLTIGGSGTITGTLAFSLPATNQRLAGFTLNRTGAVLGLGSYLYVDAGLSVVAGQINALTPNALSLTTLPSSVSIGATINGSILLNNASITNNGTISIPAGNYFQLAGTASVTGNAINYLTATSTLAYNPLSTRTSTNVEFPPTMPGRVNVYGAGTLTLNNSKTISGTLQMISSAVLEISANTLTLNGDIDVSGGSLLANLGPNLVIGGSGTFTGNLTFTGTQTLTNFFLNRPSVTIPLGSPLFVNGQFTHVAGILQTTPTNILRMNSNNPALLGAGSATAYINGPLERQTTAGMSYDFPVGDATNYRPIRLNNIAGTLPIVRVSYAATGTSTFDGTLTAVAPQNWRIEQISGTYTNATLERTDAGFTASSRWGRSAAQAGIYTSVSPAPVGMVLTSNTAAATVGYYAVGTVLLPTTFYFNTGDPSVITNWGSMPGGTGTPPADFTTMGNTYIMETGKNGTLAAADLTFSAGTTFTMNAGSTFNFGTRNLILNGIINLGGQFVGNGASTLTIGGSGAISGNIAFITTLQLSGLSINRPGSTINFSSSLATSVVNLVAGSINFSTHVLSCNGNSTFGTGTNVTGGIFLQSGVILTNNGTINIPAANYLGLSEHANVTGNPINYLGITSRLQYILNIFSGNRGTSDIEFPQVMNAQVEVMSVGSVTLTLNNSKTVNGLFTLDDDTTIDIGASNTLSLNSSISNFGGTGSFSGGTNRSLIIGGTGTFTGNLNFSGAQQLQNFTINRAGLTIPLGSPLSVSGTLALTNGILNSNGNTFTVSNTATNAISGGSSTSYVRGTLIRNLLPSIAADGTSYTFPVGDATGYKPLNLNNVRTGVMSPAVRVTPAQIGATTPGNGINTPFAEGGRNWRVEQLSGNFNSATVELFASGLTADSRVARSTAQAGPYDRVGQTGGGASVLSDAGQTPGYFAIGTRALQTVLWTGGGMAGNWNDPANWGGGPVPNGADFQARFNGSNITFTSGLPMTLGSLLVEGGAVVDLQQASTLNLTASGMAIIVRGNSQLLLQGTNIALTSPSATASVEAGSSMRLGSNLTLGANGSVTMAGSLFRTSGQLLGGSAMPITYTSGSSLVYMGAGNVATGAEFPPTLPTGVSLVIVKNAGTDVVTLNQSKNIGFVSVSVGRLAIPAGATFTINQNSGIGTNAGFDLAAMSVLEVNNCTLSNGNPTVGATGGINVQAASTLRLRDAASVTMNAAFYANVGSTLEYAGSTAKITTLQELPAIMPGTLVVNNGGGVTLDATARLLQGGLTLTNGILTTPAAFTIDQTIPIITGGNATSHIRTSGSGILGRILPAGLVMSATQVFYPIGDASGFRPFTLTSVSTGVMPVTTALSTSPSGATSVGAGLITPFVEMGRNWKFDISAGTLSNAQITLQAASALNPMLNRVGMSTSGQAGVYDRTTPSGGTVSGLTITSDAVNFPAAPVTRHFAIANLATTFYYISGDPALPASWRTDAAGTGGMPLASDFTTSGRTFIIPTPRTATMLTPLTFGTGVNFTMEAGTALTLNGQTLTLAGQSNIAGTLTLDGASQLAVMSSPVIQSGGVVRLVGNASSVTNAAPLYLAGSTLQYDNRTAAVGLEFPPAPASNPMLGNVQLGGMMGASTMTFGNSASITGGFTLQGASQLTIGGMNTDIQLGGSIAFGTGKVSGTASSLLRVNGSGTITGGLNVDPPNSLTFMELSRPARLTLASPLQVQTLVLQQGTLDARTNATTVRLTGGSGALIQNGSGAVDGNLEWQLPANISADGQSFTFPLSQGGTPRIITLQNIRTGADAPTVRLRFDSTGAMTASANGGLSAVQPANWRVEVVSGDFLSSIIALNEATYQTTNRIGTSTAQAGQYERVSSGAAQTTSRVNFSPPTTTRFFAIGTASTNPTRYTLRNAGNPANPADWLDSAGRAAPDFITPNSEFVIPVRLAPVRLLSDLTLGDNVSLVVRAGAKLTIPDGRRLQLGSGGMLVEAGTTVSMNIGGTVEVEGSGIVTGGSSVYAGTTATLRYTGGGGTKTATESEFPTNFGGSLELNRGGIVALTQQRTIAGTLSLQNGILRVASAQALVLTNPQVGAITGGAANSYIAGALQRAILPNLRGDSALSYSFPIGSAMRFLPLTILQPLTGAGGALFRAEGVADTARGSLQAGLTALSQTEFWRTQLVNGSMTGLVQLGGVNFATANVVSSSASIGGVFTSARGLRSGSGLVSERIALQSALVLAAAEALQPTVQSVFPTTQVVGERVTINGTNLAGVQMLDFGGTRAVVFQNSGSQITVNVPQGAQTGALRIISAAGTLTAVQNFTIRTIAPPPTISIVQPPEAAPGARLTIQGTNLGGAEVRFRSAQSTTQATISISVQPLTNSTTQIVVQVPNSATSGTITITTPNGTATSATVFRVLPATDTSRTIAPPPTITGFSPMVADSGQTITIRGTNLRSTSASASTNGSTTVLLGSTPARVISQSDTELTVQIPSNTASGIISVTTPAGTTTSQLPFITRADSLRNAQNLLPQITALQPDSARVGDTIRIVGRNFTGISAVQIGAGLVADFRIISATEIRAVVPTGASSGFVALTHPTGRVQSTAGTSFTLIRPPQMATGVPTITGFSRDTVFIGDTLIVRGTNLSALTTRRFMFADVYSMDIRTVLASTPTALTILMPAPPDTTILRRYTLLAVNSFGATTSTVGVWVAPRQRMNPVVQPALVDSARLRDSLALVSFFQITNGEAWRNRAGWGTSAPMQTWFGVTLENNRVSRLVLPNNNLRSRGLPPQFENLTSLRVVNLSGNLIGDETGLVRLLALTNLEELQLAECAFAGRLDAVRPASASQPARTLCALMRLRVLNLAGNGFSGGLPTCLGDLTELRELNIANNALTGEIPSGLGRTARLLAEKGGASLTALTNLQSLNLSGNRLSGALPTDLTAITTLRSLRLSQNRLTALPNLAALPVDTLTLGGNALTFAHLEQFAGRRFSVLEYGGQDSVGAARALTRLQGDTVTFLADIAAGGTNAQSATLYEWLRNGVSLGSPRTAANGGHRLVRDLVVLSDTGTYSYRVTHPALTALTLVSRPQTLTVLPRENPVQTDTTATSRASIQPRLVAPANDSRNVALRPTLRWTSVPGALRYEAEVRNASAGAASQPLERLSVQTDTAQRLSTTLAFETRFQWRVRAIVLRSQATAPDTSAWSENGFFTTLPPNIALGVSTFNFGKVLIDEVVQGEIAITNASETAITLRSVSLQAGENEFSVENGIANVRLQPGESAPVQVSYQPRDTVRRSVALRVDYAAGSSNPTFQAAETLEGRGVPLEIRPLNFGTVLVGRTFLASAQVVNRSVYNLSLDSLFVQASNAASEGVFSVERGALVQSGRLFLGSGDTTTLLVRCRAAVVGSFSGTLRLASARIDTLEVPLLARARERLSSDIVAKIGIRAEPATAKPGDTVRLRLFLAEGVADSLFRTVDVRPNFRARFRFDKYVLALANEQGGKARSIINTDPRNRVWRTEMNARALRPLANADFLAEQTIPCIALNADVEKTPLVLEDFQWGDPRTGRTYWFESADAGVFSLALPRANGSVRLFAVDTLNKPTPRLALTAVAPNPAFEQIEVKFTLSQETSVSLGIFSADGRKVVSMLDFSPQQQGEHRRVFRINALPTGAYILVAETPTERLTQRLEVVR